MRTIRISDITLRQRSAETLTFREKLELAKLLDRLCVDVIELAHVKKEKADSLYIKSIANTVKDSIISVPSVPEKQNIDLIADALKEAPKARVQICAPVSLVQMEYIYHLQPAKLKDKVCEAISYAASKFSDVEFAAEDATRADEAFLFDIVTCVNRRNYPKLNDIKEFLISKGVKRWRLFTVFPVGRAAQDPDMRLTSEEFRGVFDFIKGTREEGRIRVDYGCEGFLGNYEGEVRNRFFSCQAGVSVGSVMADGSIAACASIRSDYNQGNIYEDDFMDVWENRYAPYRNREWMRKGECKDCSYFRYCQGNGMHLRDGEGNLLLCHLKRIKEAE